MPGSLIEAGVASGIILIALVGLIIVPELVLSPAGFVGCLALGVAAATAATRALAGRHDVPTDVGSRATAGGAERDEVTPASALWSSSSDRTRELAILEERSRIAREMHDGLAQILGYVNAKAFAVRSSLGKGDTATATTLLADLEEAARDMCADVREVIMALRSTDPSAMGLAEAITGYAAKWQRMTGVTVECRMVGSELVDGLSHVIGLQVMRIIQEALSNVRRHAHASRVTLTIKAVGSRLAVEVHDDGVGFEALGGEIADRPSFGLETMAERATATGGRLAVASAPGHGTRVTLSVPLESRQP